MSHPNEEELIDAYYTGPGPALKLHLESCLECNSVYKSIRETLDMAAEASLPPRGEEYPTQVWSRVQLKLAPQKSISKLFPRWLLAPAIAAMMAIIFLAGMLTEHKRTLPVIVQQPQLASAELPKSRPVVRLSSTPAREQHRAQRRPLATAQVPRIPSDSAQDQKLLALNTELSENEKAAVPELLHMISGPNSDKTKEHALFVLAQSNSPDARKALLDFAQQSSNASLQARALRMMAVAGDEGARKQLVGLYTSSPNQNVKREILHELMLSDSKSTLLAVAKAEPDPGLRNSAIANLSVTGAESELSQLYRSSGPYDEKKQILNSVFLTGDTNTLVAILKEEKDPAMRVAAINSLATMSGGTAVLITIFRNDNDEAVRQAILDALAAHHNTEALSELAQSETNLQTKAQILRRIEALSFNPVGSPHRP